MDLQRISLIRKASLSDLTNCNYLEDLIVKLGFNTENLREQPAVVKENGGGLLIWQYPNQFSKYLCLLSRLKITSYIEIGCRWGGTFVLTNEYLQKIQDDFTNSVAVDIIDSPVLGYCERNKNSCFIKISSQSPEFKEYMKLNFFDLVFIDGDHSYEGVKTDFEITKDNGKIFVFHDIVNAVCPGVVNFWNELKTHQKDKFIFYEFIDQYDEVWNETHQRFLGIGVAVKNS